MRHDVIASAVQRALARAGHNSVLEPHMSAFAAGAGPSAGEGLAARRAARSAHPGESRGDILCYLGQTPTVIDVSVVCPGAQSYRAAAAADPGAAARARDHEKRRAYANRGDAGYTLLPFSVESHGRLGAPAMKLVSDLGRRVAEASGGVLRSGSFVEGVLQDISVALCRFNARIESTVAGYFAIGAGRDFMQALGTPSCDVEDGYY
jgi:hypothetical protein